MAKVNRFMKPVRRQVTDQYVKQFTPLPLGLMKRRTMELDEESKAQQGAVNDLYSNLKLNSIDTDRGELANKMKEIQTQVESALYENKGDYSKMGSAVNKIAHDTNLWLNTGTGKRISDNRALQDDYYKTVDDSSMTSFDKRLHKEYSNLDYKIRGGAVNGQEYKGLPVYEMQDWSKRVNSALNSLKFDKKSNPILQEDSKNGWIINGYSDLSYVDKERAKNYIRANFYNDPEFESMVDSRYKTQIISNPNKIIKDKNEFKKVLFNSMFDGYAKAYEYEQEEKRLNTKFFPNGSSFGGITSIDVEPVLDSSFTVNVPVQTSKKDYYTKMMNSEDQIGFVLKTLENDVKGFFFENGSSFKSYFTQQYPEKASEKENENKYLDEITNLALESGILGDQSFQDVNDVKLKEFNKQLVRNSPWIQKQLINKIVNGEIDLTQQFSPSVAQELKRTAQKTQQATREKEVILETQIEILAKNGRINEKEYNDLKSFKKKINNNLLKANDNLIVENLLKKFESYGYELSNDDRLEMKAKLREFKVDVSNELYREKVLKPKNVEVLKKLFVYDDAYSPNFIEEILPKSWSGMSEKTKKDFYKTLTESFDLTEDDFEKVYGYSQNVNAQLFNEENTSFLNKEMKKRANKIAFSNNSAKATPNYNVNAVTSKKVDNNGKVISEKKETINLVERSKKEFKKFPGKFLDQSVYVNDSTDNKDKKPFKPTTIADAIKERVKLEINSMSFKDEDAKGKAEKELIEKYKKEAFEDVQLVNELDTEGNYQFLVQGRYIMPISKDNIDLDLDRYITSKQKTEFRLNSWVTSAKNSVISKEGHPIEGYENLYIYINDNDKPGIIYKNSETGERFVESVDEWEQMKDALVELEEYKRLNNTNKIQLADGSLITTDEYFKLAVIQNKKVNLKK